MKSLESFDCGKGPPVHCIDVPDGNGTHYASDAVAKQSNRDGTQDNSSRAQRQVVEEVLRRKHLDASGSVGGGRGSDSAYCVLFQIPRPRIDKRDDSNLERRLALATLLPPSGLVPIATGEKGGPCFAEKVGNEDDKSSPNGD